VKNFIALAVFLLSFQSPVSAMMRSPIYERELQEGKDPNRSLKVHEKRIKAEVCAQAKAKNHVAVVTAQTAIEIYGKINHNWTYPQNGYLAVTSPYWEPKDVYETTLLEGKEHQAKGPTLILKCEPREIIVALEDLVNNFAALECTVASSAVKFFILKELLGAEDFTTCIVTFYNALKTAPGPSTEIFFINSL
jgi:hypothetical protein